MQTPPIASPQPNELPRAKRLDGTARRVLMLVNRKAGNGLGQKVVHQAIESLEAHGYDTKMVADANEFADLSHRWMEQGELRLAISAGGDGTLSLALNSSPQGTPLLIFPLGTENLLARYVGHKRLPLSIVPLIESGVVIPLDAARAGDRLFCIVFSAGLDSEVVREVHHRRGGNITHLAYAAPLFKTITGYRYPQIKVTATNLRGEAFEATGCWTFGVNLPRYALGLPIAPAAVGTDGQLDVCVLERGSLWSGLSYVTHMVRRRHHLLDHVHAFQANKIRFEALGDQPVTYQVDGDPGGLLPVELSVEPRRMHLLVEPLVAKKLGFAVEP
ncbi:diacylglycerol/lipid kinase family protein [Aeoliella mucimassa]|uniref:Diacylglycerol kinase n=1 Tax=Aeoliella mucimassa TaxID=2527972 RepID=A0A518AK62_9BACT|nr:diacylglycerol kinase family protein [Aeoliella mucimassa]QDU55119.1 Diacylglycerol kinase [Aeoliella mucimassa]